MANAAVLGERLLALAIDGQHFGVPSTIVREVARMPRLARVPHAPPALMGLANVRGAVVPVLSLATLLDRAGGDERRIVIVDDGETLGLAVDGVSQLGAADAEDGQALQRLDVSALVARSRPSAVARRSHDAAIAADGETVLQIETVPLVVCAIGGQEFAFPLGMVEEVLRVPAEITRMPLADPAVVGSMAVHGRILPLLSLRVLLGLPEGTDETRGRILLVRVGGHRVGLVVDAMRAILSVSEDDIDSVPQVLARGGAEARIQAICRLDSGTRLVSILAAEHLLRDDITARLFEGSEEQTMSDTAIADTFEQFLVFRIGAEDFGLPIGAVEEVASLPEKLTRLPKAPAFVKGVMNLRGQVIPVIDQAQRFGSDSVSGGKRRVMVVRIGDLVAGFVVDAVSDVLRVAQSALRPAPDLGNDQTRVFDRVANLERDERIVLIVSPRELLDRAEQDLLRAIAGKGAASAS
ncbi:chemotaxis protein CheW [Sphingomonas immobilis]|uniref:Chemotaxis protein CheW n=1 Tax=Sphingomonas immobilis TaxID=3063997 RepID=A0ABT8ZW41_9SPHN|nr:chemotaxis protein CheW [Sphingomonas sp. CA1-15]MDO7841793.1 chemotaxis protein CheW [Sphingomonas sp. CA1-15]